MEKNIYSSALIVSGAILVAGATIADVTSTTLFGYALMLVGIAENLVYTIRDRRKKD